MEFTRYLSKEDITALKNEPLFTQFIMPDVYGKKTPDVFPAVRQGRIDFYHRGGKLFSYTKREGFKTHQKYASVLPCSQKTNYVTEADLRDIPKIVSFTDSEGLVYKRIKENCALYAGEEAEAVSRLYNRFSCAKKRPGSEIVVLDIEVSFENKDDDRPSIDRNRSRQDRIDILLFHTGKGELRFYEAKLYTNDEIRAKEGKNPRVLKQMEKYRRQLENEEKRERILAQYEKHVKVLNSLFGVCLPTPTSINPEPRLYVFRFDNDQKYGRLKDNLSVLYSKGILVYDRGDPKTIDINTLWKGARSR